MDTRDRMVVVESIEILDPVSALDIHLVAADMDQDIEDAENLLTDLHLVEAVAWGILSPTVLVLQGEDNP